MSNPNGWSTFRLWTSLQNPGVSMLSIKNDPDRLPSPINTARFNPCKAFPDRCPTFPFVLDSIAGRQNCFSKNFKAAEGNTASVQELQNCRTAVAEPSVMKIK
jgi:hypothetical protein